MGIANLAVRFWNLFFSVLVVALIGSAIHDAFAGNPASVNFAIFVAVISLLIALYEFVAHFIEAIAIPIALMAADGVASLLCLIAGIVLAANLRVHSCGNKVRHPGIVNNH